MDEEDVGDYDLKNNLLKRFELIIRREATGSGPSRVR